VKEICTVQFALAFQSANSGLESWLCGYGFGLQQLSRAAALKQNTAVEVCGPRFHFQLRYYAPLYYYYPLYYYALSVTAIKPHISALVVVFLLMAIIKKGFGAFFKKKPCNRKNHLLSEYYT